MFIKGKALGLIGSIITIVSCSLIFIALSFLDVFFSLEDFESNFIFYFIDRGWSVVDAEKLFTTMKLIINIGKFLTLFSTFLGTLALILVILITEKNVVIYGWLFIFISILSLLCLGLVSFVIFLISGIRMIKLNKET